MNSNTQDILEKEEQTAASSLSVQWQRQKLLQTLEDSGQTLKVVYEFNSEAEQTAMKAAVDALWSDAGGQPYAADDSSGMVEHFKTEWYATDGTTVDALNNIGNIRK